MARKQFENSAMHSEVTASNSGDMASPTAITIPGIVNLVTSRNKISPIASSVEPTIASDAFESTVITSTDEQVSSVGRLRRPLAAVGAIGLAASILLANTESAAATAPSAEELRLINAANWANKHGYTASIAILDTETGQKWGRNSNHEISTQSVIKVAAAAELVYEGKMHGATEKIAYKAVTQSDDTAGSEIWGEAGGSELTDKISKHFMHGKFFGDSRGIDGWWSSTKVTASSMVQFYNSVRHNKKVWPWVYNAMRHATKNGSDGQYQWFGIPHAVRKGSWAIKQGWGEENGNAVFNSTGYADNGRYAVAILLQQKHGETTYGQPIENAQNYIARHILPNGEPAPNSKAKK